MNSPSFYIVCYGKRYAIRRPGSKRVSAVLPTLQTAITQARKMNPKATIYIARVRFYPGKDRWRKI